MAIMQERITNYSVKREKEHINLKNCKRFQLF